MLCNLAIAVPNIITVIRLSDVGRLEPSDVSSVAWLQWRGGELATVTYLFYHCFVYHCAVTQVKVSDVTRITIIFICCVSVDSHGVCFV
jgi:hypothetical protein